jgi:hypothetical protein
MTLYRNRKDLTATGILKPIEKLTLDDVRRTAYELAEADEVVFIDGDDRQKVLKGGKDVK